MCLGFGLGMWFVHLCVHESKLKATGQVVFRVTDRRIELTSIFPYCMFPIHSSVLFVDDNPSEQHLKKRTTKIAATYRSNLTLEVRAYVKLKADNWLEKYGIHNECRRPSESC